ncbi:MAG TPA: glucokinase [Vicinamibacterales bacterium]|jgi:glucokinase|nr:glucokinase [Vicinamibacterales bacterium]
MILSGDVGGTKTLLGVFEPAASRPRLVTTASYVTNAYHSFTDILDEFDRVAAQHGTIDAVAVGVAGPVIGGVSRLTNISWDISAAEIRTHRGIRHVELLNDLEAIANSVELLTGDEVAVLQPGVSRTDGNGAVIAAGTGLGQAYLHRVNGRMRPVPSEGGHADYAARTDREIEFVRMLREQFGRAEVEQVLSGPGLINLHRFTHRGGECDMLAGAASHELPARISQAGLTGRCQQCAEALRMFVSAYGAEAGNLALRAVATSGLYVGGGIAPKILPALQTGTFMDAFVAKEPMRELLERVPVKVILNPEAGLIGAAVHAQSLIA